MRRYSIAFLGHKAKSNKKVIHRRRPERFGENIMYVYFLLTSVLFVLLSIRSIREISANCS